MSKIEIGRFSERLRKVFGMAGQELVASELSPEVSPVVVLQDNSADQQFLQGVRLCASGMVQPGTAAQQTVMRWLNPPGSGVLCLIDYFTYTTDADTQANFGFANTAANLPTAGSTGLRDHRWTTTGDSTTLDASRTSAGTGISLAETLFVVKLGPSVEFAYQSPVVLLPGEALELGFPGASGLDITVQASMGWSERRLPPLET